jgi:RNA polymerase sigma-70 factor (ECF subfamily)
LHHDEELMATYARTGSHEAFEDLVQIYKQAIYRYLYYLLHDAHLAEDAFQATFLQLHLKCHQFQPGRRFRPWLYAIAKNQAIDLGRRNRRHKTVSLHTTTADGFPEDEGQPLGARRRTEEDFTAGLEAIEDRERARLAVDGLPPKLRQVLLLVVYQGLKYREAAKALGIPSGTVKSRMNKALRSLREAFAVDGVEAPAGPRQTGLQPEGRRRPLKPPGRRELFQSRRFALPRRESRAAGSPLRKRGPRLEGCDERN